MTTPLQNEYTSKIAEMEKSLLGVRMLEEEIVPQMRGSCITRIVVYENHLLCISMVIGIVIASQNVPIEFTMTEYSTHMNIDDRWYSPPFYK